MTNHFKHVFQSVSTTPSLCTCRQIVNLCKMMKPSWIRRTFETQPEKNYPNRLASIFGGLAWRTHSQWMSDPTTCPVHSAFCLAVSTARCDMALRNWKTRCVKPLETLRLYIYMDVGLYPCSFHWWSFSFYPYHIHTAHTSTFSFRYGFEGKQSTNT